ncbi:MAG: amidohydrolase family protein [Candidatus Marinimicrobia bacterium]|nr:amidohydrolase family protein [Candidatus Neomarinimicrobiota bacterium]
MRSLSNKLLRIILFVFIPTATSILASDEVPSKKQDHPIALIGATIHPVNGDVIENGTILFENGKIKEIGVNVILPSGTESIDISGKHIYPGLINADTRLGLMEIGSVPGSRDDFELGAMNPNVKAEVALNPDSELLSVVRAHGITVANSFPRGGIISGKSAAIMLDGWTSEDMTLKAPVAMHMNWPSMTLNKAWWNKTSEEDQIKARKEALEKIDQFFDDAKAYMTAKAVSGKNGLPNQKVDLRLEAMIPVLKGDLPLWIAASEIRQIQAAIDWAESKGVKTVIYGGADSWRLAKELKKMNIPVVINSVLHVPSRAWEGYDTGYSLPNKLYQEGVKFCIGYSTFAGEQHNVRYNAAMAVAHGLPVEEGIKSITIYAAEIMGIDDRVGSLEVGKDATLIVTDGNPLEITTSVSMEFIEGRIIDLDNKHKRLYRKYTEKYRQKGLLK